MWKSRWSLLLAVHCAAVGITACATARSVPATDGAAAGPTPGVRMLDVDSIRLWYRVAGDPVAGAPPVIFLHGGPGQGSEHFEVLVGARYEGRLQMVYLDQRGSGRSGRGPASAYTIDRMVGDIDSVRKSLGVQRVALVGHSFGAALALEYAARHPGQVAGVVFAAGLWDSPYQTPLRCTHMNAAARPLMNRLVGDSTAAVHARDNDCSWTRRLPAASRDSLFAAMMFRTPELSARLDSIERATGRRNTGEVGGALGRAGLGRYQFTRFDRVTMPVLVIAGRQDGGAVPEGQRELVRRLPNARYVEYENSGHFVYLDEPERFARDVEAFVRGLP